MRITLFGGDYGSDRSENTGTDQGKCPHELFRHRVIDEEKTRGGLRYIIDIEAIPEEYAAVVKTLTADKELEQIYSTTGDCRIHCVGRSRNQSTMESHVTYLFNHTKGIRKISWHILLSDLKHAEEGDGYGTEKEKFQGV